MKRGYFGTALVIAVLLHAGLLLFLHRGGRTAVRRPGPSGTEVTLEADPGAAPTPAASSPAPPAKPGPPVPIEHRAPHRETGTETETGTVTETGAATEAAAATGTATEAAAATGTATGTGTTTATATGAGTGSAPGALPAHVAAPIDRAARVREILARIRAARRYPELARRRELEGRVRVGFVIDAAGHTHALHVAQSADPLLDQAALEAVERAQPLPTLDGPVEVDIDFQLSD